MFDYSKIILAINDLPDDVLEEFQKKVLQPIHLDMDWTHTPFLTDSHEMTIILNVEIIAPKHHQVDELEITNELIDFTHDTHPNIKGYIEAVKKLVK